MRQLTAEKNLNIFPSALLMCGNWCCFNWRRSRSSPYREYIQNRLIYSRWFECTANDSLLFVYLEYGFELIPPRVDVCTPFASPLCTWRFRKKAMITENKRFASQWLTESMHQITMYHHKYSVDECAHRLMMCGVFFMVMRPVESRQRRSEEHLRLNF